MPFRKFVFFTFILLLAIPVFSGPAAHAQKALTNNEVSVNGLYQFTPAVSGNGITDTASKSGGAAAFFDHSYHWWLGYEAGYVYSRYTEFYTGQVFGIQHNMHEFSGSYYVHGTSVMGLQPFAAAGVSAVIFSPSLNGGQNVSWQARPGLNFGAGVNVPLFTGHYGLRAEYRAVAYKTPDFGLPQLTTNAYRITSDPMVGIYIRF